MRGCGHGNGELRVEHAREIEQVRCIAGGKKTGPQRRVVARAFAFRAQAGSREPAQRMEPVESRRDVRGQQDRRIAPADVGRFMRQYGSAARARPGVRAIRQQDDRSQQSRGQRTGHARARQNRRTAPCGSHHRAQPNRIEQKAQQQDHRAGNPDGQHNHRPVDACPARSRRGSDSRDRRNCHQ